MLLSLLLGAALAQGNAATPAASTAAAAGRPDPGPENPWSLSYGVDRRGTPYGRLDYRLRWSFEDIQERSTEPARPRLAAERALRGLLQGSRLELYGVRVRPFRELPLLARESGAAPASGSQAPPPAAQRPVRLSSWERLYDELERSARREAERFLIREGFDRTLPAHRAAPYERKKALGEGLLDLGREGLGERESRP